jgi:hypothetical protein
VFSAANAVAITATAFMGSLPHSMKADAEWRNLGASASEMSSPGPLIPFRRVDHPWR